MLPEGSNGNHVRPIVMSAADRAELERLQRGSSAPAGLSPRARAVLLMVQGRSAVELAERIGYTLVQLSRIRRRSPRSGGLDFLVELRRAIPGMLTGTRVRTCPPALSLGSAVTSFTASKRNGH